MIPTSCHLSFSQYFSVIIGSTIGGILVHGVYVWIGGETRGQAKDRFLWQGIVFGGLAMEGIYHYWKG